MKNRVRLENMRAFWYRSQALKEADPEGKEKLKVAAVAALKMAEALAKEAKDSSSESWTLVTLGWFGLQDYFLASAMADGVDSGGKGRGKGKVRVACVRWGQDTKRRG